MPKKLMRCCSNYESLSIGMASLLHTPTPEEPTLNSSPPGDCRRTPIAPSNDDLVSAFLQLCRFRCEPSPPTWLSAPWGLEFGDGAAGFIVLLGGKAHLKLPGGDKQLPLAEHEFVLVTRTCGFIACDHDGSHAVSIEKLRGGRPSDAAGHPQVREDHTRLAWGRLRFEDEYSRHAFELLPAVVRVPAIAGLSEPAPLLRVLVDELAVDRPGRDLLIRCLVQVLLVQGLRHCDAARVGIESGLIAALRVAGLSAALKEIHARPQHDWSVRELADIAGLSRAAFASRFLEALGRPPFQYLRDVRMHYASSLLRDTAQGVKEIAIRVGYATEASFSKAFTRWCEMAPGEYRRRNRHEPE